MVQSSAGCFCMETLKVLEGLSWGLVTSSLSLFKSSHALSMLEQGSWSSRPAPGCTAWDCEDLFMQEQFHVASPFTEHVQAHI